MLSYIPKFEMFVGTDAFNAGLVQMHKTMRALYQSNFGLTLPSLDATMPIVWHMAKAWGFRPDSTRKALALKHMSHHRVGTDQWIGNGKPTLSLEKEFFLDIEFVLFLTGYYKAYDVYSEKSLRSFYCKTRTNIYWYIVPHECWSSTFLFVPFFKSVEPAFEYKRVANHFVYENGAETADIYDLYRY